MTDQTPVQPAAKVLGGLTPYLQLDGAFKAAEFYKTAFGAEQVFAYPADEKGRTMHIHLHINGSTLMLSDFYPENGMPAVKPQGYTMQLHIGSDDIDTWWKRAVDAGCEVAVPLQVMFWGDQWGNMRDPFGVEWAMNAPAKKA
ncbi:glyoxalase [Mesorhizobium sp. Root102]|uniref:VOC family protein n=1 Tax=Mesorhizobium sp. Root102 TaxID=1736422 RepID=UPI0006F9EE6D|nr:glyoxalase/bleomycin resistance/extradiol dioxygenase family protein [Mesorhizobium sp. Root102]KQU78927.1 glyoxalase [Mesorhizobium sp. Root102]